jgi:cytochrome c-type biogenesis protein CcmH/NrfG
MSEDINQEVLKELRKVTSWGRRVFWLLLLLLIVSILSYPISRRPRSASRPGSWESVTTAVRQQDFQTALAEAQALVAQEPSYYYGHAYLGAIYLAMGDVTNAELHYSRAYELFPNEEADKNLAAVRKRLQQPMRFLSK